MDARPSAIDVESSEDESDSSSSDKLDELDRAQAHLHSLQAVKRSELQRDRAIKVNKQPEKRRWHERKKGENNPKNMSAFARISKFPGEYLESQSRKLFCYALLRVPFDEPHHDLDLHLNTKVQRRESVAEAR